MGLLQRRVIAMSLGLAALGVLSFASISYAEEEDALSFFKEEAKVVSASLEPSSIDQSPSTVYIVTQKDIRDSGAQSLWEVLRSVPGMDVMSVLTSDGEMSVRGFNTALSARLMVLLDGREMNYLPLGNVIWAALPVPVSMIDRIEVVQGPASAVYGTGAMAGVINIITKTPEQLQGGVVSYVGGERHTQGGDLVYGRKIGAWGYRLSGGYNQAYSYNQASRNTNELSHAEGLVNYAFSEKSVLNMEGGFSRHAPEIFGTAPFVVKGQSNFVKTDYRWRDTTFRGYWNRDYSHMNAPIVRGGDVNYDQVDMTLMQAVSLPWRNRFVLGGNYRFNHVESPVPLGNQGIKQDLWSVFGEDKWQIVNPLMLMVSGRVDHHPETPTRFSPRASLVLTPVPRQVFRASAGRAFRNPTIFENYVTSVNSSREYIAGGVPGRLFPFQAPSGFNWDRTSTVHVLGNTDLNPEKVDQVEAGYDGRFERVHVMGTLFHFRGKDAIGFLDPTLRISSSTVLPFATGNVINPLLIRSTSTVTTAYGNDTDVYKASGGEFGTEYYAFHWLKLFGNYSYQYIWRDSGEPLEISPRHKVNMGLRVQTHGWTWQWESHWVDGTRWTAPATTHAYWLCNSHVGYAFPGRLKGLELGFDAFNLLNHKHYEYPQSMGGEAIRSSLRGTLRYEF